MRKRVYIAYTGGTIGMRRSASGYRPHPGYLAQLMAAIPELRHPSLPHYQIHEYQPLLDSAEMAPDDWLKIAADIAGKGRDGEIGGGAVGSGDQITAPAHGRRGLDLPIRGSRPDEPGTWCGRHIGRGHIRLAGRYR